MDEILKNNSSKTVQMDSEYSWLETMPETIQDWLGSAALTYLIIDLNKRLGLNGVRISTIPYLIFRIANKELPPEKLAGSLAQELNFDPTRAAVVAKEIEEKMLRPIEIPLRREAGIDIKMIYAGIQANKPKPTSPTIPTAPPIYKPATPVPPVYRPAPPTPPTPPPPASTEPKEMPVKINVQPLRPTQGEQPFGADSWVNKIK